MLGQSVILVSLMSVKCTCHFFSTTFQVQFLREHFSGVDIEVDGGVGPSTIQACAEVYIRKTSPCNEYPLVPHFYIVKLGYAGVYLFFLFLVQIIDCGYLLELPWQGGSNVYPQSMF